MSKKLKILHLEDLHSDAELISKVLQKGKLDFERLVVDTREKFLKALEDFSPDIILSDHSMPSFDSHAALSLLQQRTIKIPFILITANISEEFAVDVIKRGADDYILKDRLQRLPAAIFNALEKFRLERERQIFLDELIKNEKRYRALVENGADAVVIFNLEGKPTYISPSTHHILGYSEEDTMNLDLHGAMLHADDKDLVRQKMEECLANPGIAIDGIISRVKHKNGSWIWLEETFTNMLHNPAINGITDNFRDITYRKQAEQKLNESEIFSKGVLASLSAHISVIDETGTLIAVNKAWDEYGINNGALSLEFISKGSNYFDVCKKAVISGDAMAGIALKGIQSVLHKEIPFYELEYPCHSPDQERWFLLSVMSFGSDDLKVVTAHQDITERKNAEKNHRESELRFRQIVETAQEGIWLIDENNITTFVNKKLCEILEYSQEEMMGKHIYYFMDEEGIEIARQLIEHKKSGNNGHDNFKYIAKNGKQVWTNLSTNPIFDEQGNYKGFLAMVSNITERLAYVSTIEEQNKKLREIAFIQSHVVRAPLARMMGLIGLIQDTATSKSERDKMLNYLLIAAYELDTHIKDISDKTYDVNL